MSEIHSVNILVRMSAFSHVFFDITQLKGCDCAMPELRTQNRLRVNCIFSGLSSKLCMRFSYATFGKRSAYLT